jgi:hypothetical protein
MIRADSGFCRWKCLKWCDANGVYFPCKPSFDRSPNASPPPSVDPWDGGGPGNPGNWPKGKYKIISCPSDRFTCYDLMLGGTGGGFCGTSYGLNELVGYNRFRRLNEFEETLDKTCSFTETINIPHAKPEYMPGGTSYIAGVVQKSLISDRIKLFIQSLCHRRAMKNEGSRYFFLYSRNASFPPSCITPV